MEAGQFQGIKYNLVFPASLYSSQIQVPATDFSELLVAFWWVFSQVRDRWFCSERTHPVRSCHTDSIKKVRRCHNSG